MAASEKKIHLDIDWLNQKSGDLSQDVYFEFIWRGIEEIRIYKKDIFLL